VSGSKHPLQRTAFGEGEGRLLPYSGGMTPGKKIQILCARSCILVHFGRKWFAMPSIMRLKHFNNGNAVPMRSGSFLTMGF